MPVIQAAVARRAAGELEIGDVHLAPLRRDEVRVRLVATGICHADVLARDQIYAVPLPAVFGHEGAGVIEEVGDDVQDLSVGDHVVLGFNYCGDCRHCRGGYPGNCAATHAHNFGGYRLDGSSPLSDAEGQIAGWFFGQSSFATHANVPARIAVRVDRDVPLELLAPLGCGVMTGTGVVWNVLRPAPGTSFAVFGAGAVGLSALLAARLSGCTTIVAVDVNPVRRTLALELGATHAVDARRDDVVDEIRRITDGGVETAVDATGAPAAFRTMLDSLGVRGHGAMVGAPAPGDTVALDLNPSLGAGRRISFVLEGDAQPRTFIPRLVELIRSGQLDYRAMITRFPFAEINSAMASAVAGNVVKPVVLFT